MAAIVMPAHIAVTITHAVTGRPAHITVAIAHAVAGRPAHITVTIAHAVAGRPAHITATIAHAVAGRPAHITVFTIAPTVRVVLFQIAEIAPGLIHVLLHVSGPLHDALTRIRGHR